MSIYSDLDEVAKNATFLRTYIYNMMVIDKKEVVSIIDDTANTLKYCVDWIHNELRDGDVRL